jgi:hypothetical protein
LSLKIPPESLQSLLSFVRRQPIVMDAQRVFPQTVSVTLQKDLSIGAKNTSPRSCGLVTLPQHLYPSLADVWLLLLLHGSCISAVSDFVVENGIDTLKTTYKRSGGLEALVSDFWGLTKRASFVMAINSITGEL